MLAMSEATESVLGLLAGYLTHDAAEAADVDRVVALARRVPDPWLRSASLHLTASALIVAPGTGQVLLRWHQRQQAWLQVGGHGDPGESDALAIALREAAEETGLPDLAAWPDRQLRQVAVVPVPASRSEPAHEHADLRFVLATGDPAAARPESAHAPLRWLDIDEANALTREDNLRELLARVRPLLEEATR